MHCLTKYWSITAGQCVGKHMRETQRPSSLPYTRSVMHGTGTATHQWYRTHHRHTVSHHTWHWHGDGSVVSHSSQTHGQSCMALARQRISGIALITDTRSVMHGTGSLARRRISGITLITDGGAKMLKMQHIFAYNVLQWGGGLLPSPIT